MYLSSPSSAPSGKKASLRYGLRATGLLNYLTPRILSYSFDDEVDLGREVCEKDLYGCFNLRFLLLFDVVD